MKPRHWTLVLTAVAVFALGTVTPASAWHYLGGHWERQSWTMDGGSRADPRISLHIAEGATFWWASIDACSAWANRTGRLGCSIVDYNIGGGDEVSTCNTTPAAYYHVQICAWWYGFTGWAGVWQASSVSPDWQHYYSGNILYNYNYDPWPYANHLACHELGHMFGLAHASSVWNESCMRNDGTAYAHPAIVTSPHDIDILDNYIYNFWDGDPRHPGASSCGAYPCSGHMDPPTRVKKPKKARRTVSIYDAVPNPNFAELDRLKKLDAEPGAVVHWHGDYAYLNELSHKLEHETSGGN